MANGNDVYQALAVGNAIHHAPLADTHTPKVDRAFKLYHAARPGIVDQCLDHSDDAASDLRIEIL